MQKNLAKNIYIRGSSTCSQRYLCLMKLNLQPNLTKTIYIYEGDTIKPTAKPSTGYVRHTV
jgi:hypothetical protein